MKRIIKYKKYILGIIAILLITTISIGIKYIMLPKYKEIPEVKLKDVKKEKALAIMVSNDGNKYEEYNKDTWPGNKYVYKEAKCIDNNGKEVEDAISFERETNTVTLETEKTIYCTLYFDYKGTGEEKDPYRIQYIEDLVDLQIEVTNGETYANKYFELERNLDFKNREDYRNPDQLDYGNINGVNNVETIYDELNNSDGEGFIPIGTFNIPFQGIFDGKEYSIKNIYIKPLSSKAIGLFGGIKNGTIKNLTVEGEYIQQFDNEIGGIVACLIDSIIDNCVSNVNVSTISSMASIGGLVSFSDNDSTIKNSINKGSVTALNTSQVGGIIGCMSMRGKSLTISNSSNEGTIISNKGTDTGGIIGRDSGTAGSTLTITNSFNKGNINFEGSVVGGIIGAVNNEVNIEKSYNIGNVTANGTNGVRIGGLIGLVYKKVVINNSYNADNKIKISPNGFEAPEYIGGLVGGLSNQTEISIITNSHNSGEIVNGNRVGGLIGELSSGIIIDRSYNTGNINVNDEIWNSASQIGGLIGMTSGWSYIHPADVIMNSYNTGNIVANNKINTHISGITGNEFSNKLILLNSYNAGDIDLQSNVGSANVSGIIYSFTRNVNSSENNINILNNVYNIGILNNVISNKFGLGYFDVNTTTNDIKNTYYENSVSASNVTGIGGTPMSLNNMKLESFVTQLNTNKNTISLSSIDSSLSEYTLCNWKLGSSGYPELAC